VLVHPVTGNGVSLTSGEWILGELGILLFGYPGEGAEGEGGRQRRKVTLLPSTVIAQSCGGGITFIYESILEESFSRWSYWR
jgi:hypothetical protein